MYTGWPRSGWPEVGHFDQKIKVNQIASYCAMLYPSCCSLWPCTFLGLHSSDFGSSEGQTRGSQFNFFWGTDTTVWSYVYFLCSCVTEIDFYHLLRNWQVKRLIKQHKKINKMCLFVFENKFEHVTSKTQFMLTQIRVATFLHIMLQVCHRGKSSHKSSVTLWNDLTWRNSTANFVMILSLVLELSGKLVSHISQIFMLWCLISMFHLFFTQ